MSTSRMARQLSPEHKAKLSVSCSKVGVQQEERNRCVLARVRAGETQASVARDLGLSKQRVGQIIKAQAPGWLKTRCEAKRRLRQLKCQERRARQETRQEKEARVVSALRAGKTVAMVKREIPTGISIRHTVRKFSITPVGGRGRYPRSPEYRAKLSASQRARYARRQLQQQEGAQ